MKKTYVLPIPCDISVSAIQHAACILGTEPQALWIHPADDRYATVFGDLAIHIDETLPEDAWYLEDRDGNCVYSEGA